MIGEPLTSSAAYAAIDAVTSRRGVSMGRLLSADKGSTQVVVCRWECFARLRALQFSYPVIGEFMNRRHDTVLRGLRRFIAEYPELAAQIFGERDEIAERRAA